MALTRSFKETVASRVRDDPAFARALLDEAIQLFIAGECGSAKLILRDLVNAIRNAILQGQNNGQAITKTAIQL
jgi:hypothetical protein